MKYTFHVICTVLLCVLLFPSVVPGITSPPSGTTQNNFDIRTGYKVNLPLKSNNTKQTLVYPPIVGDPLSPRPGCLRAVDRIKSNLGMDTVIRWNTLNGLPRFFFNYHQPLSTDPYPDPVIACEKFLENNKDLLPLPAGNKVSFIPSCSRNDKISGSSQVYFQQCIQGIPVYHGMTRFNLDYLNRVVSVSAGDIIIDAGNFPVRYKLSATDVIMTACRYLGHNLTANQLTPIQGDDGSQHWFLAPGFQSHIAASKVIFPVYGSGIPAWRITLQPQGYPALYQFVIDGSTGKLLQLLNLTRYVQTQGNVFTIHPMAKPQELVQFPDDSHYVVPESPIGWQYLDETIGNNTEVKDDRDGDNEITMGMRAVATGSPLYFNFTYTGDPAADLEISIANLFYGINFIHDWMYRLGFDEDAGNFQTDNFGLGGKANDFIYGDAQDGGIPNNASFSPAVDGRKSRMSMGVFSDSFDSSLDMDVVYHEYLHGVSTRLVGGCDIGGCMNGIQSGAMGEGIADFFPCSIFNDPLMGEFSSNDYINGIRTSKIDSNTYTYGNLCSISGFGCEYHADGEIWASTMWDLEQNFKSVYGYPEARDIVQRMIIEGMKFSICSPSYLDMRDAILLANYFSNSAANECLIWETFSNRGMGFTASTTGDYDRTPVEAFDLPPWCISNGAVAFSKTYYNCQDKARIMVIDPTTTSPVSVEVISGSGENETFYLVGSSPFYYTSPIEVIEVASTLDIITGNNRLEVLEGDSLTATYNDSDPAGHKSIANAGIKCRISVGIQSYKFLNGSCDDDTVVGFPDLPGFLDANEYADMVISITNLEPYDLLNATITISTTNPKLTILSGASQYVGTMPRAIGNSYSSVLLTCQVYADPVVLAGETADFMVEVTGKGVKGTIPPLSFPVVLNMDYNLLTNLNYQENFETSSASSWAHDVTDPTTPGDEWHLETCHSYSSTTAYHNGGPGCTDYSDNQGDPFLSSPDISLSTPTSAASRIRSFSFYHDIDLGSTGPPNNDDADLVFVGLMDTSPDENMERLGFFMNFPPYINSNTGGIFKKYGYSLLGNNLELDLTYPVNMIWVFMIDVTDPSTTDAVGKGYYLDDVDLYYDLVEVVPQGITCSDVFTPTPNPTITPFEPTPTHPLFMAIPSGSSRSIGVLSLVFVIIITLLIHRRFEME